MFSFIEGPAHLALTVRKLYRRGRISLALRSMLELDTYVQTTYPDERLECTICMTVRAFASIQYLSLAKPCIRRQ